jgi:hypothetical protein
MARAVCVRALSAAMTMADRPGAIPHAEARASVEEGSMAAAEEVTAAVADGGDCICVPVVCGILDSGEFGLRAGPVKLRLKNGSAQDDNRGVIAKLHHYQILKWRDALCSERS